MKAKITILAIETSCDETGMALVRCSGGIKRPRFKILENIVSSQIPIHRPFGGVVPNLAKREHIKNLPKVFKKLKHVKKTDVIAVTVGPGLEPALWTGINFAEKITQQLKKPLMGVNHLEGHLYSNLLPQKLNAKQRLNPKIIFPAIALIVSGGHTILLKMRSLTKWEKLGETLDDAAGEAFDKVAKMLELPYPGGPEIEKLALSLPKGQKPSIPFPRPMLNQKNYNFSFSGLKTSVLYYLRDHPDSKKENIAASFQEAAIDVLVKKTASAAREFQAKSVMISGGVAANKPLNNAMRQKTEELKIKFWSPDFKFNTDNAAVIAIAAYINLLTKKKKLPLQANGNLTI